MYSKENVIIHNGNFIIALNDTIAFKKELELYAIHNRYSYVTM